MGGGYTLQIIIIFDESDTIVWQTEIIILDTDGKRYIEIEIGEKVDLLEEKKSSCYIEIDTESEVYRVLSDVFDELQA